MAIKIPQAFNLLIFILPGPWGGPEWEVFLPPTAAGGPHTITVTDGTDGCLLQLDDVLFGDVYVCSGQSNMQWRLAWVISRYSTQIVIRFRLAETITCGYIY